MEKEKNNSLFDALDKLPMNDGGKNLERIMRDVPENRKSMLHSCLLMCRCSTRLMELRRAGSKFDDKDMIRFTRGVVAAFESDKFYQMIYGKVRAHLRVCPACIRRLTPEKWVQVFSFLMVIANGMKLSIPDLDDSFLARFIESVEFLYTTEARDYARREGIDVTELL